MQTLEETMQEARLAAHRQREDDYQKRRRAKVTAQNKVNAYGMELAPLLQDWLRPYVGCKLLKVDGSFLKSIAEEKPAFERPGLRWWLDVSRYSIFLQCDVCEQAGEHSCTYQKQSFYIAEIDGVTLSKVVDETAAFRTDYTLEGIDATLAEIKKLEAQISELKKTIYPFGDGLTGH